MFEFEGVRVVGKQLWRHVGRRSKCSLCKYSLVTERGADDTTWSSRGHCMSRSNGGSKFWSWLGTRTGMECCQFGGLWVFTALFLDFAGLGLTASRLGRGKSALRPSAFF